MPTDLIGKQLLPYFNLFNASGLIFLNKSSRIVSLEISSSEYIVGFKPIVVIIEKKIGHLLTCILSRGFYAQKHRATDLNLEFKRGVSIHETSR